MLCCIWCNDILVALFVATSIVMSHVDFFLTLHVPPLVFTECLYVYSVNVCFCFCFMLHFCACFCVFFFTIHHPHLILVCIPSPYPQPLPHGYGNSLVEFFALLYPCFCLLCMCWFALFVPIFAPCMIIGDSVCVAFACLKCTWARVICLACGMSELSFWTIPPSMPEVLDAVCSFLHLIWLKGVYCHLLNRHSPHSMAVYLWRLGRPRVVHITLTP